MGTGFIRDIVALLRPFVERHADDLPEPELHLQILSDAAEAANSNRVVAVRSRACVPDCMDALDGQFHVKMRQPMHARRDEYACV